MTALLTRQHHDVDQDRVVPAPPPNTAPAITAPSPAWTVAAAVAASQNSGWCPHCYGSGDRSRRRYTLAADCTTHRRELIRDALHRPAGEVTAANANAGTAPATRTRLPDHPRATPRARAQGRLDGRHRMIRARTLRPDGRFRLPKTWRRALGGLHQPRGQVDALDRFHTYLDLADRRADRREHELAAFRTLVARADWKTMTSSATREQMADSAGVSVHAITTYVRAWRQADLVRVVLPPLAPGRAFGRGAFAGAGRAPIYALTYSPELAHQHVLWTTVDIPDLDESTVDITFAQLESHVDGSADPTQLAVSPVSSRDQSPYVAPGNSDIKDKSWPRRTVPVLRADRHRASRQLIQDAGWGRQVTIEALDAFLEPWWATGWCLSALLWALDHHPDGTAHIHTDRVRHPLGWATWRLAAWRDSAGRPVEPPIAGTTYTANNAHNAARVGLASK